MGVGPEKNGHKDSAEAKKSRQKSLTASDKDGQKGLTGPEQTEDSDTLRRLKRRSFRRGAITGVVCAAAVLLVCGGVLRLMAGSGTWVIGSAGFLSAQETAKLTTIANYIRNNYYEDVDEDAMKESLYAALFEDLDDYSEYFTAEEYQTFYEDVLADSFAGIGAVLTQDTETMTVTVTEVYDDSPAEEAGLQAGDILVSADSYTAEEMELDEFVTKLRGEEGTEVSLTFYRESTDETFTETVTRAIIDVPTVEGEMLDDGIAYLQLSSFSDDTGTEFADTIEALEKAGMEKLIIDLRGNTGGTLTAAIECLDRVIEEGKLLVYTIDRNGDKQEYYAASEEELSIPIVLLTDGNTASAAEIFTGALRDYDLAVSVGTKTYGKGVVQTVQTLTDGSAVKLTTSSYYTPDGVCIQGTGLEPDIELSYTFLGEEDDAYSYAYDNQIQRAIRYLKKH